MRDHLLAVALAVGLFLLIALGLAHLARALFGALAVALSG